MSTVISIMDRDHWDRCTDNIVVADPKQRMLIWVPRDLWSDLTGDRINTAFKRGGHALLMKSLVGFGLCVRYSICALPKAVCRCIENCAVNVPVNEPMEFYWPLVMGTDLEQGKKVIQFSPPVETLSGERIHQWIGSRKRADGIPCSDLKRIERQQVLIGVLLQTGFDFSGFLGEGVSLSDGFSFDDLRSIDSTWKLDLFGRERLRYKTIAGKKVISL